MAAFEACKVGSAGRVGSSSSNTKTALTTPRSLHRSGDGSDGPRTKSAMRNAAHAYPP